MLETNMIHHGDCLELMKQIPDKSIDLVLTDPPYGINFGEFNRTNKTKSGKRYKSDKYKNSDWDNGIPKDEFFAEIFRISKNQVIWGAITSLFYGEKVARGSYFGIKNSLVKTLEQGNLLGQALMFHVNVMNSHILEILKGTRVQASKYIPLKSQLSCLNGC